MASMDESVKGRVLWYELMTTDVKGAERFYSDVVGWTVSPFDGSQDYYGVWSRKDGTDIGGVMEIPEGVSLPPHWGMYVGVPNLEDAVAEIGRRGGGTLSETIEVPRVGRMRTMRDPQGAAFSILEPAMPGSPGDREPEVGDASWHELYTSDPEAALSFYSRLFGWAPTEAMDMGSMGKYHMFGRGRGFGGGIMKKPAGMQAPPAFWGFYFRVPDVHAAVERVKANGGQVVNGPMEVPGGDWAVNCMDAQGAAFGLHHKKK